MNKSTPQLINQDSGKTSYYTPGFILQTAIATMGAYHDDLGKRYNFHLDPASDAYGNQIINASYYYDEQMNGLNMQWNAETVWLNHPYSRSNNRRWVEKAIAEYNAGRAKQICMITWASTSEKWFQPLFRFPICFLNKRVRFIDPNRVLTSGATKSSVVTYMGPRVEDFIDSFSEIGNVMLPPSLDTAISFGDYCRLAQTVPSDEAVLSDDEYVNSRMMACALGLAEEAGELAGLHKKLFFFSQKAQPEKISEELGDALWYIAELGGWWGLTLEEIANGNIRKVNTRYPKGAVMQSTWYTGR